MSWCENCACDMNELLGVCLVEFICKNTSTMQMIWSCCLILDRITYTFDTQHCQSTCILFVLETRTGNEIVVETTTQPVESKWVSLRYIAHVIMQCTRSSSMLRLYLYTHYGFQFDSTYRCSKTVISSLDKKYVII